jgi:hypothetical protein
MQLVSSENLLVQGQQMTGQRKTCGRGSSCDELMGVGTLVSLEEYLHTSYRPDCDFVEGHVLERNVGLRTHSSAMG